MAVLLNSRFLYRVGKTTYYWRRQGENKRVHFSNISSTSVVVSNFTNGPFEILQQLALEKTLESNRIHIVVISE